MVAMFGDAPSLVVSRPTLNNLRTPGTHQTGMHLRKPGDCGPLARAERIQFV